MVCGIMLMFFQAMTGINSVIFYSSTIFGFAGVSQAILATVIVGVVNLFSTVMSAGLVDKHGRKVFLTMGTSVMVVSLLVLSFVLWFGNGMGTAVQGAVGCGDMGSSDGNAAHKAAHQGIWRIHVRQFLVQHPGGTSDAHRY